MSLPVIIALLISKAAKVYFEYWVVLPAELQGISAQVDWFRSLLLPRAILCAILVLLLIKYLIPAIQNTRMGRPAAFIVALLAAFLVQKLLGNISGLPVIAMAVVALAKPGRQRRNVMLFGAACSLILIIIWLLLGDAERNPMNSWLVQTTLSEIRFTWWLLANDIVFILFAILGAATFLAAFPTRLRPRVIHAIRALYTVALIVLACDLAYFIQTHQLGTIQLLAYLVANLSIMASAVAEELHPKLLLVLAGIPSLILLTVRVNKYVAKNQAEPKGAYLTSAIVTVMTVAALARPTEAGFDGIRYEPYTRNLFVSLARDIFNPSLRNTLTDIHGEIRAGRIPLWNSKSLRLAETGWQDNKNVVLVMLESVRATATTLHNPDVPSMPFLSTLKNDSLVIPDMYAVIPRTSASWVSAIYGVYPGSNSVMRAWGRLEQRNPMFRSLPDLLREKSYRSAFFTPTRLDLDNEGELVSNMNFDHVVSESDVRSETVTRINYMGVEDKAIIPGFEKWVNEQVHSNTPFFSTIMTNVGHHNFRTPDNWTKRQFPGVVDSDYNNYLNCLLYIDGFIESVVKIVDSAGVLDSTVFIIVGDHGDAVGTQIVTQSVRTLNDPNMRVLAMIYAPGVKRLRGESSGPRQLVDLVPTVADILGYELEGAELPGSSLLQAVDPMRTLFFSGSIDQSYLGLQEGNLKYFYYFGRRPTSIFNLHTDPNESQSLLKNFDDDQIREKERTILRWRELVDMSLQQAKVTDDADST